MFLATLNIVGGFVVTDRMLEMFKGKPNERAKPATDAGAGAGVSKAEDGGGALLMLATTFTLADGRDLAYLVAIIGFIRRSSS